MRSATIIRILGLLLMLFSTTLLPPLIIALSVDDGALSAFTLSLAVTLGTGFLLWLPTRHCHQELLLRDGFMVVVLFWVVLGLFGALPLLLGITPAISWTDAVFESISGLTTTGATLLVGIDDLPTSLLWYRQQLQWFGGMGIIVLAVAILPLLGIGGMQLYRAETPGPVKDNKLTPRITETAKTLWYLYLGLTLACAMAYWVAGMDPFDAISHAFATVAIGGFSTHDASMGYFQDQPLIEAVAILFMLLAGINFALHFAAWSRLSLAPYRGDSELRAYLLILGLVAVITSLFLYYHQTFTTPEQALLHGVFQAVSIGTTTGFTTSDYHNWPSFLPVLLLFASFIGGCAGSTGGGMKVIRFVLLFKQGVREIQRLIHPNAVIPIRIGGKRADSRVIEAVWGFFATYVAIFSLLMLLLMADGLDQITAFSAVAACINNLGPGLGEVGSNYATMSDFAKWLLSLAMLLGRLEIFTLLVLFTPTYWRN